MDSRAPYNQIVSLFFATKSALLKVSILALTTMLVACGPPVFDPPTGDYAAPVNVTVTFPDATAVYYTLDGTEPTEDCLNYTAAINIPQTSQLLAVPYYGEVKGDIEPASYNIAGSADATVYTNQLMAEGWAEYEDATRQIFKDLYFGGCEPVVRCGGLTMSDLGLYHICDLDPSISDTAVCEAAGGGWIGWNVIQEGLGGKSIFTYRNFALPISTGSDLRVTGMIVGHFNSGGTGLTNTLAEGETLLLSGAYNGTIDDFGKVTNTIKNGGILRTTCTDTGCAEDSATYTISAGPVFSLVPYTEPSCKTEPKYLIQQGPSCIAHIGVGNPVDFKACDEGVLEQRWKVTPNDQSLAEDDYRIQQEDGIICLEAMPPAPFGPQQLFGTALCDDGSAAQNFTYDQVGVEADELRFKSTAFPDGEEYCFLPTALGIFNLIAGATCDTPDSDFGFKLVETVTAVAVDPATALEIKPKAEGYPTFHFWNAPYIRAPAYTFLDLDDGSVSALVNGYNVASVGGYGLGVKDHFFDFPALQWGEVLTVTFSEPTNVKSILMTFWLPGDRVTLEYDGGEINLDADFNIWGGNQTFTVNLEAVSWIRIRGQSGAFTYLGGINVGVE